VSDDEKVIREKLTAAGWKAETRSFYDEEGVEGWVWIDTDGTEQFWEIGDWNDLPPISDELANLLSETKGVK
jgi:hypothetical protein